MLQETISKFDSVLELRSNLTNEIVVIEKKIQEYSDLLGEKIRINQEDNKDNPDFLELKQKLEETPEDKKKKRAKKKKQTQWYALDGILIYDGVGLNGEIELYFKGTEQLKLKLEKLHKVRKTLDMIVEKGLKEDMGCIVFQNDDDTFEIVLLKSATKRTKFSFKSNYSVKPENTENLIELESKS